ncbi:helix-turn-helix domain-containing protein [Cupriavidus basilensis]|uniref:helix-turn-helix domain-containing protein n=1 Tax=Cupriavidus basilensis TaxID=68895 RepID=UPI0007512B6F|nr:helix-turn-helix domain-containing protein [Cupriavidus basilensis]
MRTLDTNECAEFLKVCRETVLRLAQAGEIYGARIGHAWVFMEDDLVEYLRRESRRQTSERQTQSRVMTGFQTPQPTVSPIRRRGRSRGAPPALPEIPQPHPSV